MSVKHNQGIVVDGLKLLFDGKDPASKSDKVAAGDLSAQWHDGRMYGGSALRFDSASINLVRTDPIMDTNPSGKWMQPEFDNWGDFTIALWVYPQVKYDNSELSSVLVSKAEDKVAIYWYLRINYSSGNTPMQIEFSDYNSSKAIEYRANDLDEGN